MAHLKTRSARREEVDAVPYEVLSVGQGREGEQNKELKVPTWVTSSQNHVKAVREAGKGVRGSVDDEL